MGSYASQLSPFGKPSGQFIDMDREVAGHLEPAFMVDAYDVLMSIEKRAARRPLADLLRNFDRCTPPSGTTARRWRSRSARDKGGA